MLQIAAHEEAFGLERLYELCRIAAASAIRSNIGRVIARPFVGRSAKDFVRTPHRKDFAVPPPDGNLLQRAAQAGRAIVSIGKIGDIFAHRDTGVEKKGKSNDANVDLLLDTLKAAPDGGLIFVNLVDFDTEYGHRRDVPGYAACLEAFDARLGDIEAAMRPTTIASSPPITATTRLSAASTTPASTCRSSPSAPARRRPDRRAAVACRHRRDDRG